MNKKIRNGADFAITQPVFDSDAAKQFINHLQASSMANHIIPIVAGIKPLFNSRNAEFLHHEVPGVHIPDTLRERMRNTAEPQQEGVQISLEILDELRPLIHGVYMMPAFGRYDLVADVLDTVREEECKWRVASR